MVSHIVFLYNIIYTLHVFHQEERGFVFESDTDTEIIPKLLKYLYDSQVPLDTAWL